MDEFLKIRYCCFLILMILSNASGLKAQDGKAERNYLSNILKQTGFQFDSARLSNWRSAQKNSYLERIDALPDSVKQALLRKAATGLSFAWPSLQAMEYLEYSRTGNRTGFQNRQLERRYILTRMVIGELITRSGKYLPQIVNGLWATLEESTWEIPAIVGLQKAGSTLPDPDEPIIGLVSAETGLLVATIRFMLQDQLDSIAPMLNKRIDFELEKRIFYPYLHRNDFWWMGFKGQSVNNWNAWINSNILESAVMAGNPVAEVNEVLEKSFSSTDYFINQYPEDGGCDEGPAYWSLAGGKLIRILKLIDGFLPGKLNASSFKLFHNVGAYIMKVHIAGDYFVNFADAGPRTIPDPESVYRYGKLFDDDSLSHFGSWLFGLKNTMPPDTSLLNFLETAELYQDLASGKQYAGLPGFSLLPDIQVATVRSDSKTAKGIFLAVQGGHNGESHNHNDVGNFILYVNGEPVIIDAGSGTYTAQTFSSRRYELWNMQSAWHNCPTINGMMQKDGRAYKATAFAATQSKHRVNIRMDIGKAWPDEAGIKKWERSFQFDQRSNSVRLTDKYVLQQATGITTFNFLAANPVKEEQKGVLLFSDRAGNAILRMEYNPSKLSFTCTEKKMEDEKLIHEWGEQLYRIQFTIKDKQSLEGVVDFLFKGAPVAD